MTNIIIYARVSSKEQSKSGYGVTSQINEMQAYAKAKGYNIVDIRTEVVSGKYHLDRRPVLKQALTETIKSDVHVMVGRLDRISRSSEFIGALTKADCKYKWFTMEDGIGCDPLILQIKASVGESFRNRLIQRGKESSAVKRDKGITMGMHLPSVAIHKERAVAKSSEAIVQEADSFAEFMRPTLEMLKREGMNFTKTAEYLNTHNFKTQRGGKWYAKTVANLFDRVVY